MTAIGRSERIRCCNSIRCQHPVHRRPHDLERLGDIGETHALRLSQDAPTKQSGARCFEVLNVLSALPARSLSLDVERGNRFRRRMGIMPQRNGASPYGSMPPLKQDFQDSGRRGLHGPSAEARSPHRPEVSPPPERGGDGQAASCGLGKRAAGKRREPTTTCDLRCGFGPAHHLVGVGLLSPRFAQVRRPYWTAPRQSFETLLWPQPRRSCGPPSGIALRAAEDAPCSLCQAWILGTRLARWWGIYLGGELRLPGSIKTIGLFCLVGQQWIAR
jgi:hypothetical protein